MSHDGPRPSKTQVFESNPGICLRIFPDRNCLWYKTIHSLIVSAFLLTVTLGFKQPAGCLAIAGLHALPIVHYGMQWQLLHQIDPVLQFARAVLVVGRFLCAAVEVCLGCDSV